MSESIDDTTFSHCRLTSKLGAGGMGAASLGMVNYSLLGIEPFLEKIRHEERCKALMSEAKQLFEKTKSTSQTTASQPVNEFSKA